VENHSAAVYAELSCDKTYVNICSCYSHTVEPEYNLVNCWGIFTTQATYRLKLILMVN